MRRRDFIAGFGSTAAWPVVAKGQQATIPVIGFLHEGTLDTARKFVAEFHRGLSGTGYIENRNVAVQYRWAEEHSERLPGLASELVHRQVAVVVALTTPTALAAKAATNSIPIVFSIGSDPVEIGLVDNLNQPGGNLTGICTLNIAVAAKRLELLHELVPAATLIAYLVNPTNAVYAEAEVREAQIAAQTLGVHLLILKAGDPSEFEAAFATLVVERAGGLVVGGDALFFNHSDQLAALAARHAMPAIYRSRDTVAAGGLVSYGTDLGEAWRQAGVYAGRILKGEKPADLPVQLVTKVILAINTKTAKAIGLTFPLKLLGRADEVIE
jgi:putative tryptophan/tyrosine transport system substrate-binding protein